MLIEILRKLFKRDLNKLKKELLAYSNESNLWVTDKNIANSSGNLCLHLIGNLNEYIGRQLGGTNFVRQKKLEFEEKNVALSELVHKIEETSILIDDILKNIPASVLEMEYPKMVFKEKMTTGYFLTHLATHLNYHLGQVSYHRRLLDN